MEKKSMKKETELFLGKVYLVKMTDDGINLLFVIGFVSCLIGMMFTVIIKTLV